MIHPHCKHRNNHNWNNWFWFPANAKGVKTKVWPDGNYDSPKDNPVIYLWKRECQNMGCDAVQFAEQLEPAGAHIVMDVGGSEELYRRTQ